ncbi:MAG: PASTA domain-containing protein [Candidatus Latescibacterota bacterium]|nr:MAG: PASTA domain-containing protein [Candidatus Latescibacterota bacterium]
MKIKSFGITVLIIVGVFVLGIVLMNSVVMPLLIHQRNTVIVPDVRQMSEQQAEKFLGRVSLSMQIDRSEHHAEIPEGYVISQRPRAHDTVKEGRTIAVVLSLGPRTQRVPDMKGLSLRQGRLLLTRQKLSPGRIVRILEETDVKERVVASSPGSGQEVEEGGEVDLLVSVGGRPRRFYMPDLDGQDLLFVKDKLQQLGFRVSNVRYEPRGDAYPNTIIDQFPKPGVMIREGDSIELVAAGSD